MVGFDKTFAETNFPSRYEAGSAIATEPKKLTNLVQVLNLREKEARLALPVSLDLWVVAVSRETGIAFLRDATGAWELKLGQSATTLQAGQQINLKTETFWKSGRVDLKPGEVTVLSAETISRPVNLTEQVSSVETMQPVQVEGVVTFAGTSSQGLMLDISVRSRHITAYIIPAPSLDVSSLLHHWIRVQGVAQSGFTTEGDLVLERIWVDGLKSVHLADATIQDWNTFPIRSAWQLQQISGETNMEAKPLLLTGALTHVSGRVVEKENGLWEIEDETGRVLVDLPIDQAIEPGDLVDVLGIFATQNSRSILFCAYFKPMTATGNSLPLLTTIEQIHRLKPDEAGRSYPVRIRGVATGGLAYIQDETRGISVSNAMNQMVFGAYYQVEGSTGSGLYAPVIRPKKITYLGPGQLPDPIHPTWEYLASGSAVCQWLELQGLVLSVTNDQMTIAIPGGRVEAEVRGAAANSLAWLENGVIRIRGTCRSEYNVRRQLTRFWIEVPSPAFISMEVPPGSDAFDVANRTVAEILQFDVDAYQIRQIKVSGQVMYHAGKIGYLTDGTNNLKYILKSSGKLQPGDLVTMVGFPDAGDFSPVLREAIWRRMGHSDLSSAQSSSLAELSRGEGGALRVCVKGRVLAANFDLAESMLSLLVESQVIVARVQVPAERHKPFIQAGSLVELTGIYAKVAAANDSTGRPNSFELLVQSPDEIKVLERPSWWTFQHTLEVVGVLVAGLLAAGGWIYLLRAKVAERTRQLRAQMQKTERTERQRALEQERSRIARDLHDNLGSSLTEISMLAETGHYAPSGDDPKNRFSQILNRAHTLVHTLDETVWAVDPAKDNLPSLVRYLTAFAEEFTAAATVSCRVEVPATIPERALTTEVRHDLFLATKEALNNAVRHSQAGEIQFQIRLSKDEMEIKVADDGRGFDVSTSSAGNGLNNLRERMSSAGRRCEIQSVPGRGTTVLLGVTLPNPDIPRLA